jgi:hypothetical protein
MPRKWIVVVIEDEAKASLAELFVNPDVQSEIKRLLKLLAEQDDPRYPKTINLMVDRIQHDAPYWWRIKVPRYAIRIIFRLRVVYQDKPILIRGDEAINTDENRYIEIMYASYRGSAYGKTLRRLFPKYETDGE